MTATITLAPSGCVSQAEISCWCEQLRKRVGENEAVRVVICDLTAVGQPDLATIDLLARLKLTAHRLGCEFSVRSPGEDLRSLLELSGLDCLLPPGEP